MAIISGSGPDRGAGGAGRRRGTRRAGLSTHMMVWLSSILILASLLLLHSSISIDSIRLPFRLTIDTLLLVGVAFVLFLALFVLVNLIWALLFALLGRFRLALIALVASFLTLLVAINSAPIGVYLEWFEGLELPVWSVQLTALLFANAMLYYFFYGFFLDVYNESKQLYVKSAIFKGCTPLDYLREHATMTVLASLSPLFYYMVSFTVFTDYLTQGQGGKSGIMGYLFTLAVETGDSEGSGGGFVSPHFWAAFSVMLLLVVPIKCALDWLRIRTARANGLETAQACP